MRSIFSASAIIRKSVSGDASKLKAICFFSNAMRKESFQKARLVAQPCVMEIHQLRQRMHGRGVKFPEILAKQLIKGRQLLLRMQGAVSYTHLSEPYDAEEYIRDYDAFVREVNGRA